MNQTMNPPFKYEKAFWNQFLNLYRSLPYLWWDNPDIMANRENYRAERARCFNKLLELVRVRFPDATLQFVQKKIHNFRCGFHREYRKKQLLEKQGKQHRPILWYYRKLLFLVDEENALDLLNDDDDLIASGYANLNFLKQDLSNGSIDLMNDNSILIKQEPSENEEISNDKIEVAPQQKNSDDSVVVSDEEEPISLLKNVEQNPTISQSIPVFKQPSVATSSELKITLIPKIFTSNSQVQSSSQASIPTYALPKTLPSGLSILPPGTLISQTFRQVSQTTNTIDSEEKSRQNTDQKRKKVEELNQEKTKKIKFKDVYSLTNRAVNEMEKLSKQDGCDLMGQKVAFDLKEMSSGQRIFAEKIINDVLYYGKSNLLRQTFLLKPSQSL